MFHLFDTEKEKGDCILGDDEELIFPPDKSSHSLFVANNDTSTESSDTKRPHPMNPLQSQSQEKSFIDASWRLELFNKIKAGQVNIENCQFYDHFTSTQVIPKKGKSSSSATFAKYLNVLDGNKLFVTKIWWKPSPEERDNSLEYESRIYETFINYLVKNNYTPHVATFLATFECDLQSFNKSFKPSIYALSQHGQILEGKQRVDKTKLKVLMTENANNSISLASMIAYRLFQTKYSLELEAICFQILYTYECFNRLGLRHNDGHLGNILVSLYGTEVDKYYPEYLIYILDSTSYAKVPCKYFIRIIDFDFSTVSCNSNTVNPEYSALIRDFSTKMKNCENTKISDQICAKHNICNNEDNKRFDAYQTFWVIKTLLQKLNPEHPMITQINNGFGNMKYERYIPKDRKMNDPYIKFPFEILKTFVSFVKSTADPDFNEDKTKYPVFELPLDTTETYQTRKIHVILQPNLKKVENKSQIHIVPSSFINVFEGSTDDDHKTNSTFKPRNQNKTKKRIDRHEMHEIRKRKFPGQAQKKKRKTGDDDD